MGLFTFTKGIAIDLGTANTIIIYNDKIVLDEPSVIAIENTTGKVAAVGEKAWQAYEKTNEHVRTVKPLKDGVIASFNAAEQMIREMVRMTPVSRRFFNPPLRMVVCIPCGSTDVEARAVREAAEVSGGKEVYLIHEPMAAALGVGLDVSAPSGKMIVDIGDGTCEVAVISFGGIVCSSSIHTAGGVFTSNIQDYVRQQYHIRIGAHTAEKIKLQVGSVLTKLQNPPPDCLVRSADPITLLPVEATVSYREIARCLDRSVSIVESAIMNVLAQTPPELYADIVDSGIFLTGGGALLRGLPQRLADKTKIPVRVVEDPLHVVARGTSTVLKHRDQFAFLME